MEYEKKYKTPYNDLYKPELNPTLAETLKNYLATPGLPSGLKPGTRAVYGEGKPLPLHEEKEHYTVSKHNHEGHFVNLNGLFRLAVGARLYDGCYSVTTFYPECVTPLR